MRTRVETTRFEFSHGHKPRGFGHWTFQTEGTCLERFSHTGTFTQSKKECQKHFTKLGFRTVQVLP